MKLPLLFCLLLTALPSLADDPELVKTHGTLLFEDDFNREEATPECGRREGLEAQVISARTK